MFGTYMYLSQRVCRCVWHKFIFCVGVSNNQKQLIWTQNSRILHIRISKQGPWQLPHVTQFQGEVPSVSLLPGADSRSRSSGARRCPRLSAIGRRMGRRVQDERRREPRISTQLYAYVFMCVCIMKVCTHVYTRITHTVGCIHTRRHMYICIYMCTMCIHIHRQRRLAYTYACTRDTRSC